ncbi:MAG: UrcA family protein [Pseudomonadota bacterium]
MKLHTGITLLIAAAATGVAGAAVPGEEPDTLAVQTMTVRYNATEISDRTSAEKLFFRIRQAAQEVCRLASYPRGYEMWDEHACETNAVAEAVRDAALPSLDQYYYRGTGPMLPTRR